MTDLPKMILCHGNGELYKSATICGHNKIHRRNHWQSMESKGTYTVDTKTLIKLRHPIKITQGNLNRHAIITPGEDTDQR